MPQPFKNAIMTNGGAKLLTRAQAGEVTIQFTRIAVGDGTYVEDEKILSALQQQTGLKSLKNSYALSSIEVYSEHSVKVTALISNQDPVTKEALITEGYFINEMGLYAKAKDETDETEVLYSIAVIEGETGDFMPPYNGFNAAQIIQEYYATVSNSLETYINSSGAVMLVEDAKKLENPEFEDYTSEEAVVPELEEALSQIISGQSLPVLFQYIKAALLGLDQQTFDAIAMLCDETAMTASFQSVFTKTVEPDVMTIADIEEAVKTQWNGEASEDETAMTPEDIEEAVNTQWNGKSSEDETALTAEDVDEATS